MKHNRVLNRPMFNPNVSAYGRGITSNLVTQQERQRFNYGGRVGYNVGSNYQIIQPKTFEDIQLQDKISWKGQPKSIADIDEIVSESGEDKWYDWFGVDGLGVIPKLQKKKWEKSTEGKAAKRKELMDKRDERIKERREVGLTTEGAYEHPSAIYGAGLEGSNIDDPTGQPFRKAATETKKGWEAKPKDVDSDQLYTPQEQAEKKSQMAFALAERLIGGSRDKWGSTAQMKNIAGGIGDIRKIADPSERREMLAKYKAWGKAQADRDVTSREHQYKMERDPEYQFETMTAVKGADRVNAINQVYGTSIRKKDKQMEKDFNKGRLPEGFIMEEAGVYTILRNGKWEIISEEEIIKNSPRKRTKKKS